MKVNLVNILCLRVNTIIISYVPYSFQSSGNIEKKKQIFTQEHIRGSGQQCRDLVPYLRKVLIQYAATSKIPSVVLISCFLIVGKGLQLQGKYMNVTTSALADMFAVKSFI